MKALSLYLLTALFEILGCYALYLWLRLDKPVWWLFPALASLLTFAWLLTLHPTPTAGRIYAAYGAIYILTSILWMWLIEKQPPDRWDLLGGTLCLLGATIIYHAPRA